MCAGGAPQVCNAWLATQHLRRMIGYQPASRFWAFQWYETGIYLALAVILAGLCFLRIRPGRCAEPGIRPRAIGRPPAPALERSP